MGLACMRPGGAGIAHAAKINVSRLCSRYRRNNTLGRDTSNTTIHNTQYTAYRTIYNTRGFLLCHITARQISTAAYYFILYTYSSKYVQIRRIRRADTKRSHWDPWLDTRAGAVAVAGRGLTGGASVARPANQTAFGLGLLLYPPPILLLFFFTSPSRHL